MKAREGENRESWFRCNRFYNLKGKWFFSTREGVDFGPFESKNEAESELQLFINDYQHSTSKTAQ
jgi:hypothetical protein